ncbi:hypothetical protein [Polynucleobacter sp. AP-Nino-20-G2]|uniref:hypothetical protein n=1 Tax=Polynucleobacter sp. AP-Nino-20-G2 TaxID=2576917 RepID=UPI001BFD7DCE|nr:hypothetical protein [Polynucleobacter sp. AP-Nino-20-G2]QWE17538.1 hypothetical protein FD960_04885 [Polynucleobacter sp. AP-Nino-20-G2]
MEDISLKNIQSRSEFLKTPEGKKLFGSSNALDWFERVNRKLLVEAGVLIKVRGGWYRIRPAYDAKVIEIARQLARKQVNL